MMEFKYGDGIKASNTHTINPIRNKSPTGNHMTLWMVDSNFICSVGFNYEKMAIVNVDCEINCVLVLMQIKCQFYSRIKKTV